MKSMERDYWRIEQCGHDGTMYFSFRMMQELLWPILNKTTCFKSKAPTDWSRVIDVKYTVGQIRHVTVYGKVDLRCGRYPGQRERVRMPVQCELIDTGQPGLNKLYKTPNKEVIL